MKFNISRRQFLKFSTMGSSIFILPSLLHCQMNNKKQKPNLLFIWTDQQRADTMAAYGNEVIHAPNLNKLAEQSFVFENAYVTQPVCTPNRASIMTGFWPHQTGCLMNNIPLKPETKCFPEILNDPDYKTAYMGKWHLGDEIFVQHGFQEWVSMEDGYSNHFSPGRDRNKRSDYHHFLIKNGYFPDSDGKFSRGYAVRRPIQHCKPKFLETKACDFLQRNREEPFILYVNFLEPHSPFWGPLNKKHDPNEIKFPENFRDPFDENDPLRYRVKRESLMEQYGESEKEIRELIARYYGLVTHVDISVGQILKKVRELGLDKNTIVVYTSDHGDMMGAHKMVTKGVMFQEAVKVPWLMRVPWLKKYSRKIKGNFSQIDMVPTLLELMNSSSKIELPGKSLVALMKSRGNTTEDIFIQWNPSSGAVKIKKGGTKLATPDEINRAANESSRAVITHDGWKLVLSDVEKCQLYNLIEDPGETTNLFLSKKHETNIKKLTKKIIEWQKTVSDEIILKQL